MKKPFKLGITGAPGVGKTTVRKFLETLVPLTVLEMDRIGYEITESLKEEISNLLGKTVLDSAGQLNRKAIAEKIFRDTELYYKFMEIVSPSMEKRLKEEIENFQGEILCVDGALIFEYKIDKFLDCIIGVETDEEIAISRFAQARGYSERLARLISFYQIPQEGKMKRSDFVIYNHGSLDDLKHQCEETWRGILNWATQSVVSK
jgi:dephospho-CoA kinase